MRRCSRLGRAFLVTAMAALLCIGGKSASADVGYSGFLDPVTNEPVGEEDESGTTNSSGRMQISDDVEYDPETRYYIYTVPDTHNEVKTTAVDGMVLTTPFKIDTGGNSSVVLYRNGKEYTGDMQDISATGEYVVNVLSGSDKKRLFGFSIIGKRASGLYTYTVPDGFYLTAVTFEGKEIDHDRFSAELAEEGEYHIEFMCMISDRIYSLTTTIDRTPPVVEFTGAIDDNNQVRSALTIQPLASGDSIKIYLENKEITPAKGKDGTMVLYDCGAYTIQAFDSAGNTQEYHFNVLMYFNLNGMIFIVIAALIVAAIVVYMILKRRKLKIG